jgi:hypothetical protein
MNYKFPLWPTSRPYVCPPDAGPAWRAAFEAGADMAGLEDNLKLSPEERLNKHARLLNDFLKREQFFDNMRRGWELVTRIESHLPRKS